VFAIGDTASVSQTTQVNWRPCCYAPLEELRPQVKRQREEERLCAGEVHLHRPFVVTTLSARKPAKSFEPMDIYVFTQQASQLVVFNLTVEAHFLWQDKLNGASLCQSSYNTLPEVVILEQAM